MKKGLIILLLVLLVLTTSCVEEEISCNKPYILKGTECCLDQNDNQVCDSEEVIHEEEIIEPTEEVEEELEENISIILNDSSEHIETIESLISNELPDRNFTLQQLEDFIDGMTDFKYFFKEENNSEPVVIDLRNKNHTLIRSNQIEKNFVIHFINNTEDLLQDMKDFYAFVKAPDWQVWRYYINETEWGWLYPELSEEELMAILPKYDYRKYYKNDQHSIWIDYDVTEKPVVTSLGTILQFNMESMVLSQFGYWQGNWEPSLLVYKVPCTKDIVVYIKPRWSEDFGYTGHANQKKEAANKNWERDIERKKPEMINYSDQIMEFCGIRNSMFNGIKFKSYENSTKLVHNWNVYFRLLYNFTFNVTNITVVETDKGYKVTGVNVSFISYDGKDFEVFNRFTHILVKMEINDSGRIDLYHDTFIKPGLWFKVGERFDRYIEKEYKFTFGENATMIFWPYFGRDELAERQKYYLGDPVIVKIS